MNGRACPTFLLGRGCDRVVSRLTCYGCLLEPWDAGELNVAPVLVECRVQKLVSLMGHFDEPLDRPLPAFAWGSLHIGPLSATGARWIEEGRACATNGHVALAWRAPPADR